MSTIVVPRGEADDFFIETSADVTATTAFSGYDAAGYADVLAQPVTDLTTGRIMFALSDNGSLLVLQFFGKGADGATAQAILERVELTRLRGAVPNGEIKQWSYNPLVQIDITAGKKTGVAGGLITELHRYADTLALVTNGDRTLGNAGVKFQQAATADEGIASMVVDGLCAGLYAMRLRCGTATAINFRHTSIPISA